jgi:hypothetical protein
MKKESRLSVIFAAAKVELKVEPMGPPRDSLAAKLKQFLAATLAPHDHRRTCACLDGWGLSRSHRACRLISLDWIRSRNLHPKW